MLYSNKLLGRIDKKDKCRRKTKRLVKKNNFCELCKSKDNLEYHHLKYDDPYAIITVCKQCHRKIEKDRRNKKKIRNLLKSTE